MRVPPGFIDRNVRTAVVEALAEARAVCLLGVAGIQPKDFAGLRHLRDRLGRDVAVEDLL